MGCYNSKSASPPPALPGLAPSSQTRHFKIVLLGDTGVGKSSLLLRQARGQFSPEISATVGAAFCPLSLQLDDGSTVKFEVWDTAGQERYASLAPLYYRGAAAALLVFDLSRPESLARAKHWASELNRNTPAGARVVVLVGNKCDLEGQVQQEAVEYAASQGMPLLLTSAKSGQGVEDLFLTLARELLVARPHTQQQAAVGTG